MRSLDCSRDVPIAENTRQSADEETYDAVVLAHVSFFAWRLIAKYLISLMPTFDFAKNVGTETANNYRFS
jgi:hypothetical protein